MLKAESLTVTQDRGSDAPVAPVGSLSDRKKAIHLSFKTKEEQWDQNIKWKTFIILKNLK